MRARADRDYCLWFRGVVEFKGFENAAGQRRVGVCKQLQINEANVATIGSEPVATRLGQFQDGAIGAEFREVPNPTIIIPAVRWVKRSPRTLDSDTRAGT